MRRTIKIMAAGLAALCLFTGIESLKMPAAFASEAAISQEAAQSDETVIRERLKIYQKAVGKEDSSLLATVWQNSARACYTSGNVTKRGWKSIKECFDTRKETHRRGRWIQNLNIRNTKIRIDDDSAVVIFDWDLWHGYYICHNSRPSISCGRTSQLWTRTGDGWKILQSQNSPMTEKAEKAYRERHVHLPFYMLPRPEQDKLARQRDKHMRQWLRERQKKQQIARTQS